MHVLQFAEAKQLQRESAARLNGFIDELRSGGKVDLSAKNLGEEGTAYIAEGLAFNDRLVAAASQAVLHSDIGKRCRVDSNTRYWAAVRPGQVRRHLACPRNRCTAVDFSKNGIGTLGMTQLCEALKNNDMLRTFIMGTNSIGDEGAAQLAGYMASASFRTLRCFVHSGPETTQPQHHTRCQPAPSGSLLL